MKVKLKSYQDGFIFTQAQFPAMVSAWGTGKSMCGILRGMILSEKYPNNLGLICRREFTDLKDSTIKDFELYTGIKVPSNKDVILPNGSVIMFRHGEELNTLKNINLGWCLIEQGEEFDDDSQWFYLFGRMRRKEVGDPSLFLIANTNGDNWIKKLWKQGNNPAYELYQANTFDNADVLPDSFLKSLETLKIQKPSVYNQFVMNSWDITSGRIFGMWDETYHVIPDQEFPDWWETFGATDTAVASGVFCAKLYKVTPQGDIIAFKEYYDKEKLISEHCLEYKKLLDGRTLAYWTADPAAFNKTREKEGQLYSIADEFRDSGIDLVRGENDVNAGINRMGEYLRIDQTRPHPFKKGLQGSPKFFVTESCAKTRWEIPLYREVPNKISDRGDRKWSPYKHNDHAVDTDRYAIMSRPQTSVQSKESPARHSLDWFERLEQIKQEKEEIYG